MRSAAVTVGTTAVVAVASDDIDRTVYLHHESNQAIYLGGSNVTTANGLHMKKSQNYAIVLPQRATLYAIADLAGQELRILTPAID